MKALTFPAALLLLSILSSCSGTLPTNLGVRDGRLAPCPETPNCVSSRSSDAAHHIDPLRFTGTPEEAIAHLKRVILALPRTAITEERTTYLRAEFTSAVFRFVDDVEFLVDPNEKVIEVRSASRLGRSDLGVNRKRVEEIRELFGKR